MLKREREDLIETNALPNLVKDRFYDPGAENDKEIFNEIQQELELKHNPGQVTEILEPKRIDYCPSMIVRYDSGEE